MRWYMAITDRTTGYVARWRQPKLDNLETTDTRVFHDLDEALDLCRRVNEHWNGEVEHLHEPASGG